MRPELAVLGRTNHRGSLARPVVRPTRSNSCWPSLCLLRDAAAWPCR